MNGLIPLDRFGSCNAPTEASVFRSEATTMSKYLWLRLPVLIVSGCLAAEGCGDDQDPEGARQLWDQIHALE